MTEFVLERVVHGRAGVTVAGSDFGVHVGIVYKKSKGETRHIHLAWNYELKDETYAARSESSPQAVRSTVDPIELSVLAGFCALRAKLGQDIPYGFRYGTSHFKASGEFVAGGAETGLTCATFVLAMFEHAKVTLLSLDTWQARQLDHAAWQNLLSLLVRKGAGESQISALRKEASCVRFRPEEVAAASALESRPVDFQTAEVAGKELSEQFFAYV